LGVWSRGKCDYRNSREKQLGRVMGRSKNQDTDDFHRACNKKIWW